MEKEKEIEILKKKLQRCYEEIGKFCLDTQLLMGELKELKELKDQKS